MPVKKDLSEPRLVGYSIEVERWDYHYSYIADPPTGDEVDEFIHLETLDFQGRLVKPKAHLGKLLKLMVACERRRQNSEPIVERAVIGHLDVKATFLDAYVRLPELHVGRLAVVASAGRINFITLFASRLVKKRALIRSVNFSTVKTK